MQRKGDNPCHTTSNILNYFIRTFIILPCISLTSLKTGGSVRQCCFTWYEHRKHHGTERQQTVGEIKFDNIETFIDLLQFLYMRVQIPFWYVLNHFMWYSVSHSAVHWMPYSYGTRNANMSILVGNSIRYISDFFFIKPHTLTIHFKHSFIIPGSLYSLCISLPNDTLQTFIHYTFQTSVHYTRDHIMCRSSKQHQH